MDLSYKLKGKSVMIKQMDINDQLVLHKLSNIGIVPGAVIKILDNNTSNKVLHLQIFNNQYVLREKDCRFINVEIVK